MRRFGFILFSLLLLAACTGPDKLYVTGTVGGDVDGQFTFSFIGCPPVPRQGTPPPNPCDTPTPTVVVTMTVTVTVTPTITALLTDTPTMAVTPSDTPTPPMTETPLGTFTETPFSIATETPTPSPPLIETLTSTPTPLPTPTPTPSGLAWNFITANDIAPPGSWDAVIQETFCQVILDGSIVSEGTGSYRTEKTDVSGATCYVQKSGLTGQPTQQVRLWLRLSQTPLVAIDLVCLSGGGSYWCIRVHGGGILSIVNLVAGQSFSSGTNALSTQQWHLLDWSLFSADVGGWMVLSVNGVEWIRREGLDTKPFAGVPYILQMGLVGAGSEVLSAWADDVRWQAGP